MLKKVLSKSGIQKSKTPSLIARDFYCKGRAQTEGEVCVDGTFEGEIQAETLIVGVNGTVKGTITATTIKSYGKMDGKMMAENIFLAGSSKTYGEIYHKDLAVETGALIEASITQKTDKAIKK